MTQYTIFQYVKKKIVLQFKVNIFHQIQPKHALFSPSPPPPSFVFRLVPEEPDGDADVLISAANDPLVSKSVFTITTRFHVYSPWGQHLFSIVS